MNNHWPILAAALMISIAVALGLWRRDSTIEALANRDANIAVQQPARREPAVAPPAEAPEAAPYKAPTPLPLANTATATSTTAVPAPAPASVTSTGTATGASKFALPSGAPPPAAPAAVPVAPAAVLLQPKAPPAPAVPIAQGQRDQVLADLRKLLEGKLTTKATDVANGGYMLKVTGAQLEVQPAPNWSVNIYNMNTQQPDAESDNFKVIYNDVAGTLGIDVNQKPATLPSGKTSLQSPSKLGNVSVVRDPANGNSVVITPNQQRKGLAPPPQAQAQPPAQPAAPAQALQPPAQPKVAPVPAPQPAPATQPAAQTPAAQPAAPAPATQPAKTPAVQPPAAQPVAPATMPAKP